MKYLSVVFFALTAMIMLASPGVMAQNKALADVNESCGYDIFTDCEGCHYGTEAPTYEQSTYLTYGACGLCTEVASCSTLTTMTRATWRRAAIPTARLTPVTWWC